MTNVRLKDKDNVLCIRIKCLTSRCRRRGRELVHMLQTSPASDLGVRQTKQPVACAYLLGYTEACSKFGRLLPMPRGLHPCVTEQPRLASTFGSGVSPWETLAILVL